MTYEFTPEENEEFTSLALWTKRFAFAMFLFGFAILSILLSHSDWLVAVSGTLVFIAGMLLYFPNDNFDRIVSTQGNDVKELIIGFKELNRGMVILLIAMVGLFISFTIETINNFT